jgi:hypothetical protein
MCQFTRGLPLENTPHDCPETALQYHSRHWVTSFQNVADKEMVAQILCLSKVFTLYARHILRWLREKASVRLNRQQF